MEGMIYCRNCANCFYSVPLVRLRQAFDGDEPTYCCLVDAGSAYGDGLAVEVMSHDSCERHATDDEVLGYE